MQIQPHLFSDGRCEQAPECFSPRFGMVEDRYGVSWMVMVEPAATATVKE